jgi:hypothetical protein
MAVPQGVPETSVRLIEIVVSPERPMTLVLVAVLVVVAGVSSPPGSSCCRRLLQPLLHAIAYPWQLPLDTIGLS